MAKKAPVPGLFIRSVSKEGFRRAGFTFDSVGYGIAVSALSEEQVTALKAEPMLVVEDCDFDPNLRTEPEEAAQ